MRNGGRSGPRAGNAVDQRTSSPSGRRREPGTASPIGEPAARSRTTSPATSSVASANVASPSRPASSTAIDARPTGDASGAAHQRPIEHADELEVRVAEEREPVVRPGQLVAAAAGHRQADRRLEQRRRGVRVGDGDDEVVDAEPHAI